MWKPKFYSAGDIVILYHGASDKAKEVKILAELNCCTPEHIVDFLDEVGQLEGKAYIRLKRLYHVENGN